MATGRSNPHQGVRLVPGLDVRAGQLVAGKYRVEERIGCGPAGVVLTARHAHMRDPVVLKILACYTDAQEDVLARRIARARIAARLRSEHIARIVEIGATSEGFPFVATERLEGTTLEAELDARGKLPVDEAVRWVLEAACGLAEAHAAGLVHGDLKPSNLFLAKPRVVKGSRDRMRSLQPSPVDDGDAPPAARDDCTLKILDFGMTSPLEALGDQSTSAFFGSPAYLAPEQIHDPTKIDARVDVWALGVCLYELVSGELPFTADSLSGVLVSVVYDAPALLTDAPYDVAKVVHRCLEKDPEKRPQNVDELAKLLAPFAGERGARISERVVAALAAPRSDLRAAVRDASTSGSVQPVSMNVAPPESQRALPRVRRRMRAALDSRLGDTRPSRRVLRRRKKQLRATALAAAGVGAIVAAIGIGPAPRPTPSSITPDPPIIPDREELEIAPAVPTTMPETTSPEALPNAIDPPASPPPPKPAATQPWTTWRAPAHPSPPRLTPRAATRLPAALPTTREPVKSGDLRKAPFVAPPPRQVNVDPRQDYAKNLFKDPK
jgi:serine/threonine protein kinase